MRRSRSHPLWPSLLEFWYVVFAACLIVLVANSKLILERAGFIGSAHFIGRTVSTKVLWGTNFLDNFRFTANVINLIVWGATGLVIYSVLQAIVQALQTIQYRRDFNSARYVHPTDFSRQAYWRQILLNAILGFSLLVLLIAGALLYIGIVLAESFLWIRRFIVAPGWHTTAGLFLGIATTIVGTLALYMILKLVIYWHRAARFRA